MTDQTLYPAKDLPLDEFGILGIGSFVHDAIIRAVNLGIPLSRGKLYELKGNPGIRILTEDGQIFAEFGGAYTPDSGQPGWVLPFDQKISSGGQPFLKSLEFRIGQEIEIKPGGGIINFGRAWQQHSPEIPLGIAVIRGEGRTSPLVEGAFYDYIKAQTDRDPVNFCIEESAPNQGRTIVRGMPIDFSNNIHYQPTLPFNVGTLVLNSIDSAALTRTGIDYYCEERTNRNDIGGIIAITPKMKHSYEDIARRAIPRHVIPIFSPTDLIQYAYRGSQKSRVLRRKEAKLTYRDILNGIRIIRTEQGENPQRIYVTLGDHGAIGVGTSGTIYRTDVFNVKGSRKTGSGDVFASMMTRFEHRRDTNKRDYLPVYAIMAYASAACAEYIDGVNPGMGVVYQRLNTAGRLHYESLGTIDTIDPQAKKHKRTLTEVGRAPVTGKFDTLYFR